MKTDLFSRIAALYPHGPDKPRVGGWCTLEKALALASSVVALRSRVSVEIGVFQGSSFLPIAMAHHATGRGVAVGIDPWSVSAAVENEVPENAEWWGKQDYDGIYQQFLRELEMSRAAKFAQVQRCKSDNAVVPEEIDFLHIDGNHTMQAVTDVERFGSRVRVGGLLCFDDIHWHGGGVVASIARAEMLGFVELYPIGTGAMYQRVTR